MLRWFRVVACLFALCASVLSGSAGLVWAAPAEGAAAVIVASSDCTAATAQERDAPVPDPGLGEPFQDAAQDPHELLAVTIPGMPPRFLPGAPADLRRRAPPAPFLDQPQRPPRA